MSEKQENEVTEEEAFEAETKLLMGIDVEETPVQEEAEEVKADDEETDEAEEAETEETEDIEPEETKEEADDLVKQLGELRQQNEKLQRALDKTNGTYGSQLANLQQQIQSLTQQRQEAANNPDVKVEQFSISDDDFKELQEEFPEVGASTAKGFERVINRLLQKVSVNSSANGPAIDESKFQQLLDEDRQARTEELHRRELRLLKREHPDCEEIAGSVTQENGIVKWNNIAFGNWVANQPPEIQEEVLYGGDAYALSDIISEYKKTLNQQPQKKPNNLKKAITPKGVPAGRNSVLDEEEQGFRGELERLMGNV